MTILISDALWFILLALLAWGVVHIRSNPWLQSRWKKVLDHPTSICCTLITILFFAIATLDSIRMTTSDQSITVLDAILSAPRLNQERSYSRPFARHALQKEYLSQDGVVQGIYPPLIHVEQRSSIAWHLVILSVQALAAAMLISIAALLLVRRLTRDLHNKKTLWVGAFLVIAIVCWALLVSRHYHILGTDKIGQDTFYEAVKGIRTAILLGTLTTLIMLPPAVLMGVMAGYFGRWVDDIVQYLYTILSSIPGILLISAMILLAQVFMHNNAQWFATESSRIDFRFILLCAILGLTSWTGLCRLLRAETLKIRALDYIDAARAFGVKNHRILRRHVLPNLSHIIIITIVLDFSGLVLAEAVLSYVGIGVEPSMPSWGNMINHSRLELARQPIVWWSLAAAFSFMITLVLAVNLLADRVRDVFNPRSA